MLLCSSASSESLSWPLCSPTGVFQISLPVSSVHLIDVAHLAGTDDDGDSTAARRDRRRLHVVVLEVVRHALVVPAQLPGRRVEVHSAVGVQLRGRVRDRRGGRLIRIADSVRHRPVAADERRLPGAARAEAERLHPGSRPEQRIELPQHRAGRRIQRDQHPAAGSDPVLAREIDAAPGHLWLDPERPLAGAEDVRVHPDRLAGAGTQRKDRCRRLPVHPSVNDSDAVWSRPALLRRVAQVLPLERPRRER